MMIELQHCNLSATAEVAFSVSYRGGNLGRYFADIVVEDRIIVELKCAERLAVHDTAQVINYLKCSGIRTGLLINFGKPRLEYRRVLFN